MSRITLNWTCEVGYESFEIYASSTAFTSSTLPAVWASGITSLNYVLENPPSNPTYVMIASVKGTVKRFSQLMTVSLKRDFDPELSLSIAPWAFYKLNELSGNFQDSSGNNRHLTASVNVLRNQDSIESTKNSSSATLHTNSTETWIGKRTGTATLGGVLTVAMWLDIPDSSVLTYGEFFKLGNDSQGFSLGFNDGSVSAPYADHAGRYLLVGHNGVAFRTTTYRFSNVRQKAHLAIRWSSTTLHIFINGVLVQTQSTAAMNSATMDTFTVGYGEQAIGFKLPMSRVAIYKGTLSDGDILKLASITATQRV